jgi:hypothetical protein
MFSLNLQHVYQHDWIGKDKVINHHQDVPYRVLEKQYTYNNNGSEKLMTPLVRIKWDNEAVKVYYCMKVK